MNIVWLTSPFAPIYLAGDMEETFLFRWFGLLWSKLISTMPFR